MVKTLSQPPKHKLPAAQLTILSICRFAEPVALTGVFPYLPEMIESFNVPQAEVAQWAGIASAIFSVSQCLTAIPWGRASDKYGRKPIILLAMLSAMVSSLLFGFSKNLTWAIIARAASGASNGNVGILRTTVAEMVPQRSLQPTAFATLPLVWQVGSIVGPILGGALASPARKMPHLFGNSKFLKKFPYALPNLVSGVIFTIGLIVGILFLKESLETKKHRRDYGRMVGDWLIKPCSRGRKGLRPADDFESAQPKPKHGHQAPPAYREVFSPQANLNLLAYFFLGMHGVSYNQLIAVFLHLKPKYDDIHLPFKFGGGFGLDSGRIGLIFTLFGVFSMLCQFTLFPAITRRFGCLNCYRSCTFLFPIVYIITPFTVLMPTPLTQQAAVMGVLILKALADVFAFPCNTILLTNSASSVRILGTLNGVGTSLSAIGRAIGPYVAGRTFTWGVDIGYVIIAWWLMALMGVVGHVVTWWLVECEGFGTDDTVSHQAAEELEICENIDLDAHALTKTQAWLDSETTTAKSDDDSDRDDASSVGDDEPLLSGELKKEGEP